MPVPQQTETLSDLLHRVLGHLTFRAISAKAAPIPNTDGIFSSKNT
jgi:hypothetical protein